MNKKNSDYFFQFKEIVTSISKVKKLKVSKSNKSYHNLKKNEKKNIYI